MAKKKIELNEDAIKQISESMLGIPDYSMVNPDLEEDIDDCVKKLLKANYDGKYVKSKATGVKK